MVFKRSIVSHVSDAVEVHHSGKKADLVVNCTGLSSLTLGGVEDKTLHPVRGQLVVVRNDPGAMHMISGTDHGDGEGTYTMTRPSGEPFLLFPLYYGRWAITDCYCKKGGGTILGGSYQIDNWDPNPDPNLAIRIMKRCIELCPNLVPKGHGIEGLSVIRHGVGLRPLREDGPRVGSEKIRGVWVVHNYGHGGYGYQASYGCAEMVLELVTQILRKKSRYHL